jgi:hypothetical protein
VTVGGPAIDGMLGTVLKTYREVRRGARAGHARTALASIVAYNYRGGFRGFEHDYRVFADPVTVPEGGSLTVTLWP